MYVFFFVVVVVGDSACFNEGLSRSVLLSDILGILTNISASILVTCSPHSLLISTHSLIGWIPQDSLICWLLIVCF